MNFKLDRGLKDSGHKPKPAGERKSSSITFFWCPFSCCPRAAALLSRSHFSGAPQRSALALRAPPGVIARET